MEIRALKLLVSQQEINDLVARLLPPHQPVRDVRVRLAPEGVTVTGVYDHVLNIPLFGPKKVSAPFETLWKVGVADGKVVVRLNDVSVGIPGVGDFLKGKIMESINNLASKEDSLQVSETAHTITLDLDRLLAKKGFPARTNLTAVWCNYGNIIIESMGE
ncbi:MAG: hypothetical protein NZT92_09170 [Abditibacteriales bacterium]|nr:hypothetical protein [Abditibacteriales bacterium]MDW8366808.1 hypothetical protein [Abditibacteriales bacterium]